MENYGIGLGLIGDMLGIAVLLYRFGTKRVINNKPGWAFRTYLFASLLLGQVLIVASMREFPAPWDTMFVLLLLSWTAVSIAATFTVSTRWIAFPIVYLISLNCFCIASLFLEPENGSVTTGEIARVATFGIIVTIGAAITLSLSHFRRSSS